MSILGTLNQNTFYSRLLHSSDVHLLVLKMHFKSLSGTLLGKDGITFTRIEHNMTVKHTQEEMLSREATLGREAK